MCVVGAKSVAHLMKFHLLQWDVVKVKLLMNSNMLNQHQKTDPKLLPTQLPTPYGEKFHNFILRVLSHFSCLATWSNWSFPEGEGIAFLGDSYKLGTGP